MVLMKSDFYAILHRMSYKSFFGLPVLKVRFRAPLVQTNSAQKWQHRIFLYFGNVVATYLESKGVGGGWPITLWCALDKKIYT